MLRRVLLWVLAICVGAVASVEAVGQAPSPQPPTQTPAAQGSVTVPRDTEVEMVLLESVSSATATKGQAVRLAVAKDVVVKGRIVIPRGTLGTGAVARLEKGVAGKRDGYLEVRPVGLTLADGTIVKLKENRTGEDDCADMGPCWALWIVGAPLLPLIAIKALTDRDEEKHAGKDMTLEICSWPGTEAYVAHRQALRITGSTAPIPNTDLPQCPNLTTPK